MPLPSAGKSGPACQVPGRVGADGMVYRAVCPVAPMKRHRPSARSTPGPISWELACTKTVGVCPALIQVPLDGTYFSAKGLLVISVVSTVWSGSSAQLASSFLTVVCPPAVQVFVV